MWIIFFSGVKQEYSDWSFSCFQGIGSKYSLTAHNVPCLFSRTPLVILFVSEFLQLFAANQNKPPDIVSILVANKSKLLRLFADFKTEKGIKEKTLD